jgi:hypothetical protein
MHIIDAALVYDKKRAETSVLAVGANKNSIHLIQGYLPL